MTWVPLHSHSGYSILDSTLSIEDLVAKAKEFSFQALALTDHGNLFGAIDFYKACKEVKIQPIIGCEVWVAPHSRLEKKKTLTDPPGYPLILLAKNQKGYQNLCKLSSLGYLEGFYYYPRIDKELLGKYAEGLICLSGSTYSYIAYLALQDGSEVQQEAAWYRNLFKEDYFFELQRHPPPEVAVKEAWVNRTFADFTVKQERIILRLQELSKKMGILCVATNDTHYLHREDYSAHEVLINIQSGEPCEIWERDSMGNPKIRVPNPKRVIYPSREFYFKSSQEMYALFSDIPEAVKNTLEVADRCQLSLDLKTRHYPIFTPPNTKELGDNREKAAEEFLFSLCQKGMPSRYTPERLRKIAEKYPGKDPVTVVKERLAYELEVITSKGMTDYMLIVYDFISWAKERKIPVGPGRGSVAGSIVAYLIGVTDIEPLRFHLFFERFINPERVSYPDIDVDICMERRAEVIDYTIRKYGKDKVAQIITFGTMKAKMALRDVGRVLSVPLSKINAIAKLVAEDPNITLDKAIQLDPELKHFYENDLEAKKVIDIAKTLEGSIRNTSIHAAGIIICKDPLTDHIPICTAKDSEMTVTQFAMKPVEAVGMLKIDFLGLKTLTSIQKTKEAVAKTTSVVLDLDNLSLEDPKTFDLLNQGKTLGVFQLESAGMQELSKQLHIDSFEELIAVGALYRPGPMDMIPSFIARKHGEESIEIDHPLLKDILAETYGVMVYQEQVMQIASTLAGYSLGEGDMLRRAMGKKDRDEMTRQREKFLKGAIQQGIDEKTAAMIFDKIEKFASYGFNKSHAAAYAYLSYVTAYLKANYPKEWMAALMTCDSDDLTKVAKFIAEARMMGIAILPPDINESGREFVATKEAIRFALTAIKGIGSNVVDVILSERNSEGVFQSLYDFIRRVDISKVSKKTIELLILAGAFDFTRWSRDALRESLDAMYEEVCQEQKEETRGILTLFSSKEKEKFQEPKVKFPSSPLSQLQKEKELLGFYLTGHPMDSFRDILSKFSCIPFQAIHDYSGELFRIAFIIDGVQYKISNKTQKKFAILTISDGMERVEVPIWPEMYEEKGPLLQEGKMLFAILYKEKKEGELRLTCKHLEDLSLMKEGDVKKREALYDSLKVETKSFRKQEVVQKMAARIIITIDADVIRLSHILQMKEIFRSHPGKAKLELRFLAAHGELATIYIESPWGVNPTTEFLQQLKGCMGVTHCKVDE